MWSEGFVILKNQSVLVQEVQIHMVHSENLVDFCHDDLSYSAGVLVVGGFVSYCHHYLHGY